MRYFIRHAMEDSGDTRSLQSRTNVAHRYARRYRHASQRSFPQLQSGPASSNHRHIVPGAQFSSSLERSRRSNGRVERNGKLVFSSSFDMAFERHLVYDLHAVFPSRSFHLQANQQPSLIER